MIVVSFLDSSLDSLSLSYSLCFLSLAENRQTWIDIKLHIWGHKSQVVLEYKWVKSCIEMSLYPQTMEGAIHHNSGKIHSLLRMGVVIQAKVQQKIYTYYIKPFE